MGFVRRGSTAQCDWRGLRQRVIKAYYRIDSMHLLMCVISSAQSGKLSGEAVGNPVAIGNVIFCIVPHEEIGFANSFGAEDAVPNST